MKAIGKLCVTKTYNGRNLIAEIYEYKTVYHFFARWEDETDYCIKGYKATKSYKTKEDAMTAFLEWEHVKTKLGI